MKIISIGGFYKLLMFDSDFGVIEMLNVFDTKIVDDEESWVVKMFGKNN